MQAFGFSASAVASTALVSGVLAAPLTLLLGALSDRLGRKRFLIVCYTLAIGGALMLIAATQLWQFWVAATLLFIAWCVNASMSAALATKILAPEAFGRGLPRLRAFESLASILGFAVSSYLSKWA